MSVPTKFNTYTHHLGFLVLNSCVTALLHTSVSLCVSFYCIFMESVPEIKMDWIGLCYILVCACVCLHLQFFRPPVYGSNGRSYKMLVMFFSFRFFISPRVLRGPSADRPETWPHGRKLSEFYNSSPKIRGPYPQKNLGPKTCKISVDFIQPPILIAQDI